MSTVLVWVLVYAVHVNSGSVANVIGDYATLADCERVQRSLMQVAGEASGSSSSRAQCVQVAKVTDRFPTTTKKP